MQGGGGGKSGGSDPSTNPSEQTAPIRLAKLFIDRLTQVCEQYNSYYIFMHEVTLFEVTLHIVRHCLMHSTQNAAQVQNLLENYPNIKLPPVFNQSSRVALLATILDSIRHLDWSGQVTHFLGLPHLGLQYRSVAPIGTPDILTMHHFINGNFMNVLKSHMLDENNINNALVCVINDQDYTEETVEQAVKLVDNALMKLLTKWARLNFPSLNINEFQWSDLTQQLSANSDEECFCTNQCTTNGEKLLREQEELSRIYLLDYLYRRFGNSLCEHMDTSKSSTGQCAKAGPNATCKQAESLQKQPTMGPFLKTGNEGANNSPKPKIFTKNQVEPNKKSNIENKRKILQDKTFELQKLLELDLNAVDNYNLELWYKNSSTKDGADANNGQQVTQDLVLSFNSTKKYPSTKGG